MTTTEQPDLLTLHELAAYLRISERTAYTLVYGGGVPAVKIGGQWRIPRAGLEAQLTRQAARQWQNH